MQSENRFFDDLAKMVNGIAGTVAGAGREAETAMREIVGKNKMDFVLYEGRAEIAASAKVLLQQILDRYNTGISISQVTLQNIQPPEQVQVLAAGDVLVDRGQLAGEADVPADLVGIAHDVVAEHPRAAAVRAQQRREHLDDRGLAGAVGAQHRQHLAGAHGQVDPGQGLHRAIGFPGTGEAGKDGAGIRGNGHGGLLGGLPAVSGADPGRGSGGHQPGRVTAVIQGPPIQTPGGYAAPGAVVISNTSL